MSLNYKTKLKKKQNKNLFVLKTTFLLHQASKPVRFFFKHGGEFVRENNTVFYRSGVQTVVSNQKVDEWSKSHLMKLFMRWGHELNSFRIWSKFDGYSKKKLN
jgi:hypothetical protein